MNKLFGFAAMIALGQAAHGEPLANSYLTVENFPQVRVLLGDEAKNGCWTNLSESRTYAEDKLREIGFDVVSADARADWLLYIGVASSRDGGRCFGAVRTEAMAGARLINLPDGPITSARISENGNTFIGYQNANTLVLDLVREHTDAIAEEQ